MNDALEKKIENCLYLDWSFKGQKGKPDKIALVGDPSGGYYIGYKAFVDNIKALIEAERKAAKEEAWAYLYDEAMMLQFNTEGAIVQTFLTKHKARLGGETEKE